MRLDPMEHAYAENRESDDVRLGDFFAHTRSGERFVCIEISRMLDANGRHVVYFGVEPELQSTPAVGKEG